MHYRFSYSWLFNNQIENVPRGIFDKTTKLRYLLKEELSFMTVINPNWTRSEKDQCGKASTDCKLLWRKFDGCCNISCTKHLN